VVVGIETRALHLLGKHSRLGYILPSSVFANILFGLFFHSLDSMFYRAEVLNFN
jgi:hypothetical protein